jgi:hypothetical protein
VKRRRRREDRVRAIDFHSKVLILVFYNLFNYFFYCSKVAILIVFSSI